ncbi:Actin- protein 6, partial [Lobulomyces angularis]
MKELPIFILDNGSYTIKAGFFNKELNAENENPFIIPNCISRGKINKVNFIGSEVNECKDLSNLIQQRPFEKGYLTNWGLEKEIWDWIFFDSNLFSNFEPNEVQLLLTEPCFNLPNIAQSYEEIVFEEYEFESLYKTIGPKLAISLLCNNSKIPDCCLVVDSSYSFTYVVPFFEGEPIYGAIKRLNIGGKVLTNILKETVSFRYYNMMDETYIINEVKEACCYVSTDFKNDMEKSRYPESSPILLEYVLPDFSTKRCGYIKDKTKIVQEGIDEQILLMNNERFTTPEIFFHPQYIGSEQPGLPEIIIDVIEATNLEPYEKELFFGNILLVGGNFKIKNFKER